MHCILGILYIQFILGKMRFLGIRGTGVGTFAVLDIQGRAGYGTSSAWKPPEFPTNYPSMVASSLHRIQPCKHLSFRCASDMSSWNLAQPDERSPEARNATLWGIFRPCKALLLLAIPGLRCWRVAEHVRHKYKIQIQQQIQNLKTKSINTRHIFI